MKILILGIGVIGTIYGDALQKAGHTVEHFVREEKIAAAPSAVTIDLLDGRHDPHGVYETDVHSISIAHEGSSYDFIIVSVGRGKLKQAIDALRTKRITGTLLLFCNFWNTRPEIEKMVSGYPYIIGFPTAGGVKKGTVLTGALFDHIMFERKELSKADNYDLVETAFQSADIKTEKPHDMVEWIWLHMAINAAVTTAAAQAGGSIKDPTKLAIELMNSAAHLATATIAIRETSKIVEARGVDLKYYRSELIMYHIPSKIAGVIMKKMFQSNELTRKIMILHNDIRDILYGIKSVYDTGKQLSVPAPVFYKMAEQIQEEPELFK